MKILANIESHVVLLLFLVLVLGDCLHWYALPKSNTLHRSLYEGMVALSSLNCFFLGRNLMRLRQFWERTRLKLVSAPAEIETKFETVARLSFISISSALCFFACVAVWGGIYLSHGPYLGMGYLVLVVLVAYEVVSVKAEFEIGRLKRGGKSRITKPSPEPPAAC